MLKPIIKSLPAFLIALLFGGIAAAQQNQQSSNQQNSGQQKQAATTAANNDASKASAPEYVDFSGFKGKIIELKHRSPYDISRIVSSLGSGFRGAKLTPNTDPPSLTIRDFPENIATIEEAVKRLDTPLPPKPAEPVAPDTEIYGYVLIASQTGEAGSDYPKAIEDVVKQLQTNLNYKNYRLLTTVVQRTRVGGMVSSSGVASLPDKSVTSNYTFDIGRISPVSKEGDYSQLSLDALNLRFQSQPSPDGQSLGNANIRTDVRIRDGEKVVVGTASLRDKALVLVLTAKVLK
ncbi:MAG TPA: hypothetical protein PLD20_04660 [Blastocatellia bacterium]|nr:hypothetical protein [Blastocatellia bacterium]HMV83859.1 hypothetical protein [Blastocatellia bacterium]HMY73420.1 hypothetical protein [Blastocatellia bacterium]HMZ17199.1 hypothetical protein [Blastocatellia bacterium]HNG31892.1 hypothetical protein [Blastocatellia bacterium]